jgi:hypothetical protein
MALNVKVECKSDDGKKEFHVLEVSLDGDDLVAKITHEGHDYAYDVGGHEFGCPLPDCYKYQEIISEGYRSIFQNLDLMQWFFSAISEQGANALATEDAIAEEIADFIGDCFRKERTEEDNLSQFLSDIRTKIPWIVKNDEFRSNMLDFIQMAYELGDSGIIEEFMGMGGDRHVDLKAGAFSEDGGDGHVYVAATFYLNIGHYELDHWRASYLGSYWDIELMDWHVERQSESEEPEERTKVLLEAMGYSDVEEYELSEIEPKEPGYPEQDGRGDWAIFQEPRYGDEEMWGRYLHEEDAQQTFSAMVDAEDAGGRSSGITVTLKHLVEHDDDDEDSETEEEWEEV